MRKRSEVKDKDPSRSEDARLRVLTATTLFPSNVSPRHGIFVQTRLDQLRRCEPVHIDVVAPVPWFPLRAKCFGRYAGFAATPAREQREGFDVWHPRYLVIPRVGMRMQPASLAASFLRAAKALYARGKRFDVIDAHYFYPDGVAAARLAQQLGLPFVITVRGSDVNLIARFSGPREAMLQAAKQAAKVIAVSQALRQSLIELGVAENKIEVLRNGVDTQCFVPREAAGLRKRFGVEMGPLVLSVGNLVPEKGHDLVLRSASRLAQATVLIVGQGPERKALMARAQALGMAQRTHFLDNMSQSELSELYSAADVLALASWREGWPNVLLEAMACATPVVAMDVGGVREIMAEAPLGRVVDERSADAFAHALQSVLLQGENRARVRAYAAQFDWPSVVRRYYTVLAQAAGSAVPEA